MSATSPDRSPGWRLATTSTAFVLLTTDVVADGLLSRLEHDRFPAPPGYVGPWRAITKLGDRQSLFGLTTLAAVVAVSRHHNPLRPAALTSLGTATRWVLMRGINRDRPPQRRWLATPDGASYPSRHATSATLGLLALRRELPASKAVTAATVLLVGVECWSRLRLGVHWPTDVTAGVLLALMVEAALSFEDHRSARNVPTALADTSVGAPTTGAPLESLATYLRRSHG